MDLPEKRPSFLRSFRDERLSHVPTPDQQVRFLELVSDGTRIDSAAREVGSTGSRFRALAKRDPEFLECYELAKEERDREHRGKIRKRLDELAFEDGPSGFAALRLQAEMYLPELAHKREKIIRHGNTEDGAFRIQAVIPHVTQEALDALPLQELETLVARLKALEEGNVTELRAIEGGTT